MFQILLNGSALQPTGGPPYLFADTSVAISFIRAWYPDQFIEYRLGGALGFSIVAVDDMPAVFRSNRRRGDVILDQDQM